MTDPDPDLSSNGHTTPEARPIGLGRFVVRMLQWFRPYPVQAVLIGLGLLVEMAWNSVLPKSFQHLIDHAIVPRNYQVLVQVLGFLAGGALLTCAMGLMRDYLYARLSIRITNDLRMRLFDHLQGLSLAFHARKSGGDVTSRFSTDLDSVRQALHSGITWGLLPFMDVVVMNLLLFFTDWRLALIAQLVWPLALVGPRIISPLATEASYRFKQEEGRVLAAVQESALGRPVIKAFGLEESFHRAFLERLVQLGRVGMRVGFLGSMLERTSGMGIMILQVVVLGVGGTFAYRGEISIGSLVAFNSLFTSMSYALFYLAQYVPTLAHSAAGLQRLDEILEEVPAVVEAQAPKCFPNLQQGIVVEELVFHHQPGNRVLDRVGLEIRQGESVAFVGASGSGKSTMLSLLLRFYDPVEGRIRYDGLDLKEISRRDFVRQTAVVFQEPLLFDISLRENIRLGNLDASDAEVEKAARAAEIHDFICSLPQGYETRAGERGGALSGGQRQRISIARALVRDPRILFLDEATSALDPGTEASINQTLERAGRGRTVIAVTHRLSSVVGLDRIFVMEKGRMVESGTHRELLARDGVYSALWRKQSGLQASPDATHAEITTERLRSIPIFAQLEDSILQSLASHGLVSEWTPSGRQVVLEGDPGDKFFIVVRGSVAVSRRDSDGERRLAVLQDGDFFGEIALLNNSPRTATVTTLCDTLLLSLQRFHFAALLEEAPGVREKIEAQIASRVSSTSGQPI